MKLFLAFVTLATLVGCGVEATRHGDVGTTTETTSATTADTDATTSAPDIADGDDVAQPTCTDNAHNGDEQGVDCGGPCPPCDSGPKIDVSPAELDFEIVASNNVASRTLVIENEGDAELEVRGFSLAGHPGFGVKLGGTTYAVSDETATGVTLPEPIRIAPHDTIDVPVTFSATGPEAAEGQLVLMTNDAHAPSGTSVGLKANTGGPCIALNPSKVQFGAKLLGTTSDIDVEVRSCGDAPLVISSIDLLPGGSTDITLLTPNGTHLTLQPNQTTTFKVRYTPTTQSSASATVTVLSDATAEPTRVEVTGSGTMSATCPTPVIVIEDVEDEGEVTPLTKLNLIGHESYTSSGSIAEYHWRVNAPVGSQSRFTPSDTAADPKFEVNVAGVYEFELTVRDSNGVESCTTAKTTIFVIPSTVIHVELLWHTPNDTDETNEGAVAGSDLDLHFAHPSAAADDQDGDGHPDPWFDPQFDCFWNNEHPNWANLSPAVDDDPEMVRDDTDGGGPETIDLNQPENGKCYAVGVHYWEDNSFGQAYATVRVYVYANLVFELEGVPLRMLDMWSVTSVCWPTGLDTPQPNKVCESSFDPCDSNVDCDPGDDCELRIARDYTCGACH